MTAQPVHSEPVDEQDRPGRHRLAGPPRQAEIVAAGPQAFTGSGRVRDGFLTHVERDLIGDLLDHLAASLSRRPLESEAMLRRSYDALMCELHRPRLRHR